MKILFLPDNIASMPALTAEKMNEIEGIEVVCISQGTGKYQYDNELVKYIPRTVSKRKLFKWLKHAIAAPREIRKWIDWADILHYTWSPAFDDGRDLSWAFRKGKPIFVEWVGSDIRDPEILQKINPYYKLVLENGYEYAAVETQEQSQSNQRIFAEYNAIPIVCAEMKLFVDHNLFPRVDLLYQRINVANFEVQYPDKLKKRPLIIHSPSAKIAKGSNYIIPIIEELKKDYDFDFQLLHDISRTQVLQVMKDCDIFLDQIMLGSYGMASMEAMSFGKPVMAFIMPEVFANGLSYDCPIFNTNPDNLKENLITLITNGSLRHDLGIRGRRFVEEYHDLARAAPYLINKYRSAIKPF